MPLTDEERRKLNELPAYEPALPRDLALGDILADLEAASAVPGGGQDPDGITTLYEEFLFAADVSILKWTDLVSGAAANFGELAAELDHPGIARIDSGTALNGFVSLTSDLNGFVLGGSTKYTLETYLRINTIPDGAEDKRFSFGWADQSNLTAVNDALYMEIDRSEDAANWVLHSTNNGTETVAATSTPFATGWQRLKIVVEPDASSAEFFIDDVSIGVVTTNIPTGAGRTTGIRWLQWNPAGTVAQAVDVDSAFLQVERGAV